MAGNAVRRSCRGALGVLMVCLVGCSTQVLKQDIPVSTNPLGAKIYADGQLVGATPGTVSLERNRSHVLTLVKEHYRQQDVVITNRYQKEKVYLKAVQSGINSGLFFKSGSMGVGSSMSSISMQESTGEAYVLYPPAVTITLTPLDGEAVRGAGAGGAGMAPGADSRAQQSVPDYDMQAQPMDDGALAKEALKIGAGAAVSKTAPLEKKWTTSSSSKEYVKPDGTRVQEKSRTSVGVGVNPAGLIDALDMLFK